MKEIKKLLLCIMVALSFLTVAPEIVPAAAVTTEVQAASVSLNKKTLTLAPGQTYQLKLNGYKKSVKWTTSKKDIVTVTQKGKLTAKKNGTAKITAKAGNKTYVCKVTVKGKAKKSSSRVWIPRTGKKYHSKKTCSRMKNPSQVSLSEAKRRGYGKCSKCW